ncbi:DUF4925 domain-containing protein [Parabacteroides gordonii]|uniref:DUF4925 domain-containing protein n=1 Tax=Parabacteroides gordonii MS-1 = DSM 23371 TaxID=1203610 RepID=A0A0F5IUN7_9BACT|nr:DUF4925 domain-containing protein [Parabacteroides gordonii]KKB49218.1 hypothetical protein HMPREF1536_04282 [Parabacteroides gordonii MS-1 = DSM 23371]MCA5585488.1 DUF4925 domain-containing protein [Parabacteroides gordonii]
MKKNFLYLFTVLCTLSFFTACGDDDDDPKDPTVLDVNTAYSGDKLDLKYGDSALLGKEITFDTKDGKTATITMKGLFNLSELLAQLMPKSTAAAPSMAPGVIPGEVTTTISNVPLILSGETYTFEGEYTGASGVKATYSGEVKKDKLTMAVKATMPTNDLVGTWALAPFAPTTGSLPMVMAWKSETPLKIDAHILDENIPAGTIIDIKIEDLLAKMNVNPMVSGLLTGVLQSITYQEDGNIVASYKKAGASDWATSPINLAQYYIANGKMYVQLNIAQIMDLVASSKADNNPLAGLMAYLSAGVPLSYTVENGKAQITADKELLLPILGLLSNETIAGLIMKAVPKEQLPLVQDLMTQLPGILATTTDVNATLYLVKQK